SVFASYPSSTSRPTRYALFPYTPLFRSRSSPSALAGHARSLSHLAVGDHAPADAGLDRDPLLRARPASAGAYQEDVMPYWAGLRSEEHTSELQSRENLVCRLLLEKKKIR